MNGCSHLIHYPMDGDYDCDISTTISCDECKHGAGRKDPGAWVNAHDEDRKEHERELRLRRKERALGTIT